MCDKKIRRRCLLFYACGTHTHTHTHTLRVGAARRCLLFYACGSDGMFHLNLAGSLPWTCVPTGTDCRHDAPVGAAIKISLPSCRRFPSTRRLQKISLHLAGALP